MASEYPIEFAVEARSEIQAMKRLKSLGVVRAEEAKLSDLDRQAGLFIIRASMRQSELTDDVYMGLSSAKDVIILYDKLSIKRSQNIIKRTAIIEQQLKKLLICVLPEMERVLGDIINAHQKHKSKLQPKSRIEWGAKISDFSFGEIPKVLEEDISKITRKRLLSDEGLLSLIASAENFDSLKSELLELSQPKTVWSSVNSLLVRPVEYNHISGALNNLCSARNDAAHFAVITKKRLDVVRKDCKHVMKYIGKVKSSYRDSLRSSMKDLSSTMNHAMESVAKIDPSVFEEYKEQMSHMYKPLTDTLAELKLDMNSAGLTHAIKNSSKESQEKIASSLIAIADNVKNNREYSAIVEHMVEKGMLSYMKGAAEEASSLASELQKSTEVSDKGRNTK